MGRQIAYVRQLSISALVADINTARQLEGNVISLENQLAEMRARRDAMYQSTWDKVKRVRASIKGMYSDDSSQYEMVGGTHLSDRKTTRRSQPSTQ